MNKESIDDCYIISINEDEIGVIDSKRYSASVRTLETSDKSADVIFKGSELDNYDKAVNFHDLFLGNSIYNAFNDGKGYKRRVIRECTRGEMASLAPSLERFKYNGVFVKYVGMLMLTKSIDYLFLDRYGNLYHQISNKERQYNYDNYYHLKYDYKERNDITILYPRSSNYNGISFDNLSHKVLEVIEVKKDDVSVAEECYTGCIINLDDKGWLKFNFFKGYTDTLLKVINDKWGKFENITFIELLGNKMDLSYDYKAKRIQFNHVSESPKIPTSGLNREVVEARYKPYVIEPASITQEDTITIKEINRGEEPDKLLLTVHSMELLSDIKRMLYQNGYKEFKPEEQ